MEQPQNETMRCEPFSFAFELSETNEEIASRIGTVREVVSRTLHSFKDAGILRLNGRRVRICDHDALSQAGGMEAGE